MHNNEIWKNIFSDPSASVTFITATLAILLNILITVFNFVWFKVKRDNERKYHSEIRYYEEWVLKPHEKIITFAAKVFEHAHTLMKDTKKAIQNTEDPRKLVEQEIESIEALYSNLERNTFLLFTAYSPELGNKIENLTTNFYDDSTKFFSDLNRATFSIEFERKSSIKIHAIYSKFINNLFTLIKTHRPN